MITGTMNELKNGFTMDIHSMTFDLKNLRVQTNTFKSKDNHPDYHIECTTPRGRPLRIGSMWKSVSEKTQNEYYSIVITDRMGRDWRMNAVRNEDMAAGEWQIVPLAGGRTEQILLRGSIEAVEDDALVGNIGSYDFDFDFVAYANEFKASDDHPDWHIEVKSPAGVGVRMGSIWNQEADRTGNEYLSVAFWSPTGTQHRANGLTRDGDADGMFEIVALTGPRAVAA